MARFGASPPMLDISRPVSLEPCGPSAARFDIHRDANDKKESMVSVYANKGVSKSVSFSESLSQDDAFNARCRDSNCHKTNKTDPSMFGVFVLQRDQSVTLSLFFLLHNFLRRIFGCSHFLSQPVTLFVLFYGESPFFQPVLLLPHHTVPRSSMPPKIQLTQSKVSVFDF